MTLIGTRDKITVFGTDYDTPDGTCIRDYIHVEDLADAHVRALDYLAEGNPSVACNLGTGEGVSVKEIIDITERVTGKTVPVEYGERRAGDPPRLVAAPALAKEVLGWEAQHKDVASSIEAAWAWVQQPHGGHLSSRLAKRVQPLPTTHPLDQGEHVRQSRLQKGVFVAKYPV